MTASQPTEWTTTQLARRRQLQHQAKIVFMLCRMTGRTMKHRCKNGLIAKAGPKVIRTAVLLASCLMQPALAYDSAKLAAALDLLSSATFPEWERQAYANNPMAQNVVGMAYKYGEVTPQNPALSLHWFLKAAQQGDADAQFNLGRIYGKATGPVYGKQRAAPRDDVTAADWYRKAAEQNYAPAQFNLGEMYAEGNPSFPRDLAQAFFWMQRALAEGDQNASAKLKKIESELNAADRDRVHHLATEWTQRHRQ